MSQLLHHRSTRITAFHASCKNLFLLCLWCGISSLSFGQEPADSPAAAADQTATEQTDNDSSTGLPPSNEQVITLEEIVVTAERPIGSLRVELETLQASFFTDYNALNPNDEFDVTCKKTDFTHTRIQRTLCLPQFFYDAMAEQARMAFINQNFSDIQSMQRLALSMNKEFEDLSANILAVANENPELAASLLEVGKVEAAIRRKQEECEDGPGFLFLRLCR